MTCLTTVLRRVMDLPHISPFVTPNSWQRPIGSAGDSYALAETISGLYETEVIHLRGPWRNVKAVEFATVEWLDGFNHL